MPVYQSWRVTCDACGYTPGWEFDDLDALWIHAKGEGWFLGTDWPHIGAALCPDCDGENE